MKKFFIQNAEKMRAASGLMAEANASLTRLKGTKSAWETIEGLNPEDLRKGLDSTDGLVVGGDSSSDSFITQQKLTSELIEAFRIEVEKDKVQAKSLEKQIKLAEKQEDYNKSIEITNQLLTNQRKNNR